MDDEACIDRPLAGVHGIDRRNDVVDRRNLRQTAAAAHHLPVRRRRIDLDAARHRKGPRERTNENLVACLDDQVERVLALDARLPPDLDSLLAHVRRAQVVQEQRTRLRVGGRTAFRRVLVTDDEKRHGRVSGVANALRDFLRALFRPQYPLSRGAAEAESRAVRTARPAPSTGRTGTAGVSRATRRVAPDLRRGFADSSLELPVRIAEGRTIAYVVARADHSAEEWALIDAPLRRAPRRRSARPSVGGWCDPGRPCTGLSTAHEAAGAGKPSTSAQADGGIRTHDPRFTRAVLWPTELRRRAV
jgi:hypothetical protein